MLLKFLVTRVDNKTLVFLYQRSKNDIHNFQI